MENLFLGILALGCGIVSLLGWLWLSAERDLSKTRREIDSRESETRKLADELSNLEQMLLENEKRLSGVQTRIRTSPISRAGCAAISPSYAASWLKAKVRYWSWARPNEPRQLRRQGMADIPRSWFDLMIVWPNLKKSLPRTRPSCAIWILCARDSPRGSVSDKRCARKVPAIRLNSSTGASTASKARKAKRVWHLFKSSSRELLAMQAAFAEAQRRFHEALVAFAGRVDTPSKPAVPTPTFEVFRGRGAQAQPISAANAPERRNPQQPNIHSEPQRQGGLIPRLRNLKTPKTG